MSSSVLKQLVGVNQAIPVSISGGGSSLVQLQGQTDSGDYVNVPVDTNGHLETSIHGPLSAFGDVKVSQDWPIFQVDASYGIQKHQTSTTTSGSGTAVASNGMFQCKTNSGVGALATIQTRRRARYRPGQGLCCRFTAMFTAGVASSYQVIGIGHAEDGLYVGYNGTSFGFLYSRHGTRTHQEITITAGASVGGSVLINGTACAVTASTSILRTAYEISKISIPNYGYPSLITESGTTRLQYVSNNAGSLAVMTFDGNGTNATATVSRTRNGAGATDTWYTQTNWNADKFDGTGNSGVTLDPTKLNVYQFKIQYLGAGALTLEIETAPAGNNATFVLAHTLVLPNTLTAPSFSIPAFPFTMATYDLGPGTDVTLQSASAAAFLEGNLKLTGSRGCFYNSRASITAASYQTLFTVQNPKIFQGKTNQCQLILDSVDVAADHNNPVAFFLIYTTNSYPTLTLTGNPSFVPYDFGDMLATIDTAATVVTLDENAQIQWNGLIGNAGSLHVELITDRQQLTIQPGETVSLCCRTVSGTASFVAGSIVWREDI